MRFWVGLTDRDWFDFLASQPDVEEVNFWQPSARKPVDFVEGEPFLFKLKPRYGGWVVGGGYWAHYTALPARMAWDVFGHMNGAADLPRWPVASSSTGRRSMCMPTIGCVALVEPFFLSPDDWVARPRGLASHHPARPDVRHLRAHRRGALAAGRVARVRSAGLR